MRIHFCLCFFVFTTLAIKGQEIYFSSITDLEYPFLKSTIGKFDLNDCSINELYVDTSSWLSGYLAWIDIAVCPDGEMYAMGNKEGIFHIDIQGQSYSQILDPLPNSPRWRKGITCTKDTVLIFGERGIWGYNLNTSLLKYYGNVPFSMAIWSNIFEYNEMLMGSGNDNIIQIDTANPANSNIHCTFPKPGLLGVFEVAISCDSVAVFAFFIDGEIYLVDPLDCSILHYCTLPQQPDETLQGFNTNFMFMPPEPCTIHLDLDFLNATINGNDYKDTLYCDLPSSFIFSETDLFSDKPWDSLSVWIEEGPPGVYLNGNAPPFATLQGQFTNQLSFKATQTTNLNQLEPYMSSLTLTGVMPTGYTQVKIGFLSWADYLVSDTAYAYITLIGRTNSSGSGQAIEICPDDQPILLSTLISDNAFLQGTWNPLTWIQGVYTPGQDPSGTYIYIVEDPFCGTDSANFEINYFPKPIFDLGAPDYLCPGDTIHIELNIPNSTITWFDGTTGTSIYLFSPQEIWVNVMDEFGCTYQDSASIVYDNECLLKEIFIPNIFSPDGNGINDEWIIPLHEGILSMKVTLFDRWGSALFHQEAPSIQWRGDTFDNQIVPQGVYVYMLMLETYDHITIAKVGNVTVLK